MKKAVVLFSGGLDSTTVLAIARDQGYEVYPLSFAYGQRHSAELAAASHIASDFRCADHQIVNLDLSYLQTSALINKDLDVPDYKGDKDIPITYVPARNTVLLSIALGYAESIAANDIFIGVSAIDYSGYPDCRPEYIKAFEEMANLATKAAVEGTRVHIHTPLIHLSKAETIQQGLSLGVDYAMTVSCYQASEAGLACGRCDSCALRQQGFTDAGVADPTRYVP